MTSGADCFERIGALAVRLALQPDASEGSLALEEACTSFGADAAAFASFVRDDESCETYRFILACDPVWCLEYEGSASYRHDPWLEYARHHAEPTLAELVPVRSHRELAVAELARQFGFASALIAPAQSPQGLTRLGVLVVGSRSPGYFDPASLPAVSFAASALAQQLLSWQTAQLRQQLLSRVRLSDEELALLVRQREGMGSKEVARMTNSTPQSIDSRWQRLNAKLGVSSRAVAARIAAEYGLI